MAAFDDTFSSPPITLPVLAMLPCFLCLHNYPFGFLHSALSSWVRLQLQPCTHLPPLFRRSELYRAFYPVTCRLGVGARGPHGPVVGVKM